MDHQQQIHHQIVNFDINPLGYYFLSEVIKENLRMIKSELDNREDIISTINS